VLLGDAGAEQAERLHLLDPVGRELVRVLERGGRRDHLLADPVADGADDLVGQLLVDGHIALPAALPGCSPRPI
jgi:hypothetical protein